MPLPGRIRTHLASNAILYCAMLLFVGTPLLFQLLDASQKEQVTGWLEKLSSVIFIAAFGAVLVLLAAYVWVGSFGDAAQLIAVSLERFGFIKTLSAFCILACFAFGLGYLNILIICVAGVICFLAIDRSVRDVRRAILLKLLVVLICLVCYVLR